MKPEFIQIRDLRDFTHQINVNHIVIITETEDYKQIGLVNGATIKTNNDVLRIISEKSKM